MKLSSVERGMNGKLGLGTEARPGIGSSGSSNISEGDIRKDSVEKSA